MNPQPSKQGIRHVWTRKHINMLGKISDAAFSRKLGLSIGTVLKKRQNLGIAASHPAKSIIWTPAVIATLGRIPDDEVARIYGMNILSVYKKRVDLGIRCYARKSKTWHCWTKKEIALLGKMPDGDVVFGLASGNQVHFGCGKSGNFVIKELGFVAILNHDSC